MKRDTTNDMTIGNPVSLIIKFMIPMCLGNLFQQFYNIADTYIVGKYLGSNALAAVGSSYTLMTFLTSILIGLCMGASAVISIQYGTRNTAKMRQSIFMSFVFIALLSLILTAVVYLFIDKILLLLQVPSEIYDMMKTYLVFIFAGIPAVFLYNYYANLLRAVGNSVLPLIFLGVSCILNIFLDLYCVIHLNFQ